MNAAAGVPPTPRGAIVLSLLGFGVFSIYKSFYTVQGGHSAVVFNRFTGVKDRVYGEGLHLAIPWIEWPTIYSIRVRPQTFSSPTGTKDLQMINITLRVLSRPDPAKLPHIHRTLGEDYDQRVLPSIAHEVLKSVVAQFDAAQIITQREQVSRLVQNRIIERSRDFNILLDDVSITHIGFSKEYSSAVEAKQVAFQEAERAKFLVEKAYQDKLRIIELAQGEAESARLISEVIRSNPRFLELRKIEAARSIAQSIANSNNRVLLNSENLLLDTVSLGPKDSPSA